MLTQPSRLQGWSNLFMSAAKEAPDLGHQTAGNGIHRSVKGDLRHAIHSQGPRRERAERGCLSDTRSHPELEAECSVPLLQKDGQFGKGWGEGEYLFHDHNHHLGGHWVLKLPSGRPTTKCF